jgi:Domain of unknown function (DUF4062)
MSDGRLASSPLEYPFEMASAAIGRTFRLFISSTFSDFIAERETLHATVFPQLTRFCRERGARFEAIDLRWGVNEAAMRTNDTLRICLEEIERSRRISPRPNFVALIGNRYGWRPLPAVVPLPIWERLKARVSAARWRSVARAYAREPERNFDPPAMILRPFRPDREEAHAEARDVLAEAAFALPERQRLPLLASATHQEIHAGLLKPSDAGTHVQVYLRRIAGLPADSRAREYLDWDDRRGRPCAHAQSQLSKLELELKSRFPQRVHEVRAVWDGEGPDSSHLGGFCELFLQHQQELIERELALAERKTSSMVRNSAHNAFAVSRAEGFHGRSRELRAISRYVDAKESLGPLVLAGPGGSGKSALIAAAAERAASRKDQKVIARFVGASPGDVDASAFLAALKTDIAVRVGVEVSSDTTSPLDGLLGECARQGKLVIFVDGVDQLDEGQRWDAVDWVPKKLPRNVRFIISARDGDIAELLIRNSKQRALRLKAYPAADARVLLSKWVGGSGGREDPWGICTRRLQTGQANQVLRAFQGLGRPLWLRILAEEARRWPAGAPCPQLPATVEQLVERYRTTVLKGVGHHGALLVDRSLAFIASCRSGISETEIGRALATDPDVQAEFRSEERTKRIWQSGDELPPVLWSRLRSDLEPFLMQQTVDGTLTLNFFHREFSDYVRSRLLRRRNARKQVHRHLAKVFESLAPGGEALVRACKASGAQQGEALRRVMEEPWHLERAEEYESLLRLLRDPVFCLAKYAANRSDDHVEFIRRLPEPQDRFLALLDRWASITAIGDQDWPAHRILLQLVLEAEPGAVPLADQFQHLVQRGVVETPPLLRAVPTRYAAHFHRRYRTPDTKELEYWCRGGRYIEVLDRNGRGMCVDSTTGKSSTIRPEKHRPGRRRRFLPQRMGDGGPAVGTIGCRGDSVVGSNAWSGCAKAAVVLGSSQVFWLGTIRKKEVLICDGFLYLLHAGQVGQGTTEVFTGEVCDTYRIEGVEDAPLYERFASTFIESSTSFVSLGWSGSDGNSEDSIVEVFEIDGNRVVARALVQAICTHDLPIQAIARLVDGTIVMLSENFRCLVATPPILGAVDFVPTGTREQYDMPGQLKFCTLVNDDGSERWPWLCRTDTQEALPESSVRWIADGLYGRLPGRTAQIEAPPGEARFVDEDADFNGVERPWLELRHPDGLLERWVSDVPIEVAVELGSDGSRYLLLKQSGPIVVQRISRG